MTKVRANLYLDKELYERALAVFKAMPGDATVSNVVSQWLSEVVPSLERLLEAAQSGDAQMALRLVDSETVTMMTKLGGHLDGLKDVRTNLENQAKEVGNT
jgi:hypothetical protein